VGDVPGPVVHPLHARRAAGGGVPVAAVPRRGVRRLPLRLPRPRGGRGRHVLREAAPGRVQLGAPDRRTVHRDRRGRRGGLGGGRRLPGWLGPWGRGRLAGRLVWAGAAPGRGEFFALGGGTLFRGYDLAQRQGGMLWVANAEFRYPVAREVCWDALDHCVGVRNLWAVGFYDAGDVYAGGRSVGGRVAHALGAGVRVDVAAFSFIERATLRLDVARSINDPAGTQVWFGLQHAF